MKFCQYLARHQILTRVCFLIRVLFSDHALPVGVEEIQPYIQVTKPANIALVTISHGDSRSVFTCYTIESMKAYAKKWNYDFYFLKYSLDESRDPTWSKIKAILMLMQNKRHYQQIVWVDDDIIITNPKKSIEYFIKKYGSRDTALIISRRENNDYINSGFMIVKNSWWGKYIFEHTWNYPDVRLHKKETSYQREEQAILNVLKENQKARKHVVILPAGQLQSILYTKQWHPGSFCFHAVAYQPFARAKMFKNFIKTHRINMNSDTGFFSLFDNRDISLSWNDRSGKCSSKNYAAVTGPFYSVQQGKNAPYHMGLCMSLHSFNSRTQEFEFIPEKLVYYGGPPLTYLMPVGWKNIGGDDYMIAVGTAQSAPYVRAYLFKLSRCELVPVDEMAFDNLGKRQISAVAFANDKNFFVYAANPDSQKSTVTFGTCILAQDDFPNIVSMLSSFDYVPSGDGLINVLVWTNDEASLIVGGKFNTLNTWKGPMPKNLMVYKFSGNHAFAYETLGVDRYPENTVCSMRLSPDGKWLLVGTNGPDSNKILLYQVSTKGLRQVENAVTDQPNGPVYALVWAPNSTVVVGGDFDRLGQQQTRPLVFYRFIKGCQRLELIKNLLKSPTKNRKVVKHLSIVPVKDSKAWYLSYAGRWKNFPENGFVKVKSLSF